MKKVKIIMLLLAASLLLTGCSLLNQKDKTYTKEEVAITASAGFVDTERFIGVYWGMQNKNELMFIAKENKSDVTSAFGYELGANEYLLTLGRQRDPNIELQSEQQDDKSLTFIEYSYEDTANKQTYSYLVTVIIENEMYYLLNIATFQSDYAKNRDKYIKWAFTFNIEKTS